MAKEETALQGAIDRLTGAERCSGMEIGVGKTEVMTISVQLQPPAVRIGHFVRWVRGTWEVLKLVLEKISWTDCVRNEEVLHGVKEDRHIVRTVK